MTSFSVLNHMKKRDWLIGVGLAFLFPPGYYLFENQSAGTLDPSVLWQLTLCCAVFFSAVACAFTMQQPWISLGISAAGTAAVCVCAPQVRQLALFLLLPAALLLCYERFAAPGGGGGRSFAPLSVTLSLGLLAEIVALVVRSVRNPYVWYFFLPRQNNKMSGFWPQFVLFCIYIVGVYLDCRREKQLAAEQARKKKKTGKSRTKEFPVWIWHIPAVLFFLNAALCLVCIWYTDEQSVPYPPVVALSALFVLLGAFGGRDAQRAAQ